MDITEAKRGLQEETRVDESDAFNRGPVKAYRPGHVATISPLTMIHAHKVTS